MTNSVQQQSWHTIMAFLIVTVALLVLLAPVPLTHAQGKCDCTQHRRWQQDERTDVPTETRVVGTVRQIELRPGSGSITERRRVTLEVLDSPGGQTIGSQEFSSPDADAACGFPFQVGRQYQLTILTSRGVPGYAGKCQVTRQLTDERAWQSVVDGEPVVTQVWWRVGPPIGVAMAVISFGGLALWMTRLRQRA